MNGRCFKISERQRAYEYTTWSDGSVTVARPPSDTSRSDAATITYVAGDFADQYRDVGTVEPVDDGAISRRLGEYAKARLEESEGSAPPEDLLGTGYRAGLRAMSKDLLAILKGETI